jgi:hypothetical protein
MSERGWRGGAARRIGARIESWRVGASESLLHKVFERVGRVRCIAQEGVPEGDHLEKLFVGEHGENPYGVSVELLGVESLRLSVSHQHRTSSKHTYGRDTERVLLPVLRFSASFG